MCVGCEGISYFETQGDYVFAVQGKKQFRLSFRLYELEQQFPQDRFMRVSKSVILNIISHISNRRWERHF
ncbi:LytTR family DNA-binding domain-containing protein [Paenibacillus sp. E194]|uniref:LytTR family DNA-binding domain-containing protein n=1 Tax=Paenibacillus sp. E194 TaxID=1458845 RepID=UPI0009E2B2D1